MTLLVLMVALLVVVLVLVLVRVRKILDGAMSDCDDDVDDLYCTSSGSTSVTDVETEL